MIMLISPTSSQPALTGATLPDHLNSLQDDRQSWENRELLRSNERLYTILLGCYQVGWAMNGTTKQHKAMKAAFDRHCETLGVKFNSSTHAMVRVVSVVFGRVERRRISAYGTALKTLLRESVHPQDFIETVKAAGGIEEVRRKGGSSTQSTYADRVQTGRYVLSDPAITTVSAIELNRKYDASAVGDAVVLLATLEPDGSFAIRRLIQNDFVVKTALASLAKDMGGKQQQKSQVETKQSQEAAREAAIADASAMAA